MNKVLIEVWVPKIECSYEIFVPINKKIFNVIKLVAKSVNELSYGAFSADGEYNLINYRTGEILDINKNIKDVKIIDGMKLILI